MPVQKEAGVVIGNIEPKYASGNPIVRVMMDGFLGAANELMDRTGATSVHEIGCGEGHLTRAIADRGYKIRACDFSSDIIDQARTLNEGRDIPFSVRSIYDLDPETDSADLIVCCEVLEHLEDPERGLGKLQEISPDWLIVSVPREPVWRALNMARGKYLGDFGNTPGHIQHWSKGGFVKLVSRYFRVVHVRSPFPWTMLLCRR